MRILSEFEKEGMKITVFSWNGKVSIKFEKDLMEQIIKFRDGSHVDRLDSAILFINDEFLTEMQNIFNSLSTLRFKRLSSLDENLSQKIKYDFII